MSEKRRIDSGSLTAKLFSKDAHRIQTETEIVRSMPDDIGATLARARTKPRWCSDVRWRMEMRRRRH